jgi:hypothetical protein
MPGSLPERTINQCPTGLVSPQSIAWLSEYYRVKAIAKATNSPYVPALADADPRTISAFEVLDRENRMIDNAIREAPPR